MLGRTNVGEMDKPMRKHVLDPSVAHAMLLVFTTLVGNELEPDACNGQFYGTYLSAGVRVRGKNKE